MQPQPLTREKMDDKRYTCETCGGWCTLEETYFTQKDVLSALEGLKEDLSDGLLDDERRFALGSVSKWFPILNSQSQESTIDKSSGGNVGTLATDETSPVVGFVGGKETLNNSLVPKREAQR